MARVFPDFQAAARLFRSRDGRRSRVLARRLESPRSHIDFDIVGAARLRPGDLILCVPDDVVPVDGTVLDGTAWTERPGRPPTAELLQGAGSLVDAGVVVRSGWLVLRVDQPGEESACA